MTVVRYNSTDVMFVTEKKFAKVNREQEIAIGSEAEVEVESNAEEEEKEEDEDDDEDEDEEICRSRPLLSRQNCKAFRWSSCKVLKISKLDEDDDRGISNFDNSNDDEHVQLKNWQLRDCDRTKRASKSQGDFLAFETQQQQQYRMDNNYGISKHCKESYVNGKQFKSSEKKQASKKEKQQGSYDHYLTGHKRSQQQQQQQRQQAKAVEERESNFNAFQVNQKESYWPSKFSKQESNCAKSVKNLVAKRRKHVSVIANRAQQRRRKELPSSVASKIITPVSLSLSSPVLLQDSTGELRRAQKQPLSRLADTFASSAETKAGAGAETHPRSQCLQALSTSDNNGFMGQLDALAGQLATPFNGVQAYQTKAVEHNGHASDGTNRCSVDVATGCCLETSQQAICNNRKADQQQEQQRKVSASLEGCMTNGRSTCCYNNNNNNIGNFLAGKLSSNRFESCDDCQNLDNDNDKDHTTTNTATSSSNQLEQAKLERNIQATDNEKQLKDFGGRHSLAKVDGNRISSIGKKSELRLSIMPDSCYPENTTTTSATIEPICSSISNVIHNKHQKNIFHCRLDSENDKKGLKEVEAKRNEYIDIDKFYQQQQRRQHHIDTDSKPSSTSPNEQQYLNDKNTTNVTNSTDSNKLMVVDLNNFPNSTSTFMGCNYWPKLLLQAGNSATYKVVKQQQVSAVSGSPTAFSLKSEGETDPRKKQETCETISNSQQPQLELQITQRREQLSKNIVNNNKTIARYSRPGRSPISLQRQTNARLTRNKLKIQQQRQEQLAHLALRERQQISHQSSNNRISGKLQNSSRRPGTDIFGQVFSNTGRRESYSDDYCQVSVRGSNSNSIESSLPSNTTNAQQQRYILDKNNLSQPDFYTLQTLSSQQYHQPIQDDNSITVSSRAIEISDNQLACSSRGQQQESSINISCNIEQQVPPSNGNVIVYKRFNMLRSGLLDHIGGQQNQLAGGGNKRSGGYTRKNEVDSEDAQTICSSNGSTISLNKPFCKICHVGSAKNGDKLISPCKCSGTMQYIHCGCLLKWLEISNRTNEKPMSCELCAHEYTWHKKFNYKEARLPRCSFKDVICHLIFLAAIGIMFLSALAPIIYKKPHDQSVALSTFTSKFGTTESLISPTNYKTTNNNDNQISSDEQRNIRRHHIPPSSLAFQHSSHSGQSNHLAATGRLASDEKFMLLCAASFFMSFFLAIYVQTKARDTLYGLFIKFLAMNQTYYITEYDHGQLNVNTNNNSIANSNNNGNIGTCSVNDSDSSGAGVGSSGLTNIKLEQQQHHNNNHHHHRQQQQQHYNSEESRFGRKSSEKS